MTSIYDKYSYLNVQFRGLLKKEILKRASKEGYNNEPSNWLRKYLNQKWKLKKK